MNIDGEVSELKILPLIAAAALLALPARASLTLSNRPTKNVDCSGGFCFANADQANLNVTDLAALLATSDIRVLTEGEVAQDMRIDAPLSWSSSHALSLESEDGIFVRSPITVEGTAHLSFAVGGGPIFQKGGAVRFWDMASQLTIEGDDYTLVNSIAGLVSAVKAHDTLIAFANDYDAKQDGVYTQSPVKTLSATLDGLGNTISNFSILNETDLQVALISNVRKDGYVLNLGIVHGHATSRNMESVNVGLLAADSGGYIHNCFATGRVSVGTNGFAGGLVGASYGILSQSYANVDVTGGDNAQLGGIAGDSYGFAGDLYATGSVTGGASAVVGGLAGLTGGKIQTSYSTGTVTAGENSYVGGLLGENNGKAKYDYWDTTTAGTDKGTGGGFTDGITGLTTDQLKAALPEGFSTGYTGYWGQSAQINGGLPYLLNIPTH